MPRKIVKVIDTCKECPYKDHRGAFGKVSYVPYCTMTGKELPHTVEVSSRHSHLMVARHTQEIPDTCPLEVV